MYRTLLLSTVIAATLTASAQNMCESIATRCEQHIANNYISDGQFYRALLQGEESAEFNMTLFGGTTYRLAACSGETDGILLFTVYDREHNVLYTNKDHFNAPYWDLSIANTIDVTVEANLDPSKAGSGCAVLLMGFKK